MKITFTNKCKDKIIHAENGIKLMIKGYAFYKDIIEEDIPTLELDKLDKSRIICKNEIEHISELKDNLFDLTYIPALDSSIITKKEDDTSSLNIIAAKMGHYEIDINKGITTEEFTNILIIGEEFDERDKYVSPKQKYFLVAVITDVVPNLENPQKIVFKVSFTNFKQEEINESLRLIDYNFNEFTKNEIIKDFNTIQLPDNYTLTPDKKNTDYDAEINIIKFDSEEGTNNVKSFPSNLVLLDKSEKINNVWNPSARVALGLDNYDKKVITPHLELSYGVKEVKDNIFQTNTVDFQFDTNHFGINQSIGINNLQVDIFPEDVDEENKRCLKKRIKRSNLFDYSLISANKAFFKYDSHNSRYTEGANYTFEYLNKNNTFGTLNFPVECISLLHSNDNTLSGNNFDSLFLNSDSNNIGYSYTNNTLINSSGTDFVNKGVYYEPGSTEPEYKSKLENNVFIGACDVKTTIVPNNVYSNNITFIGDNKLGSFGIPSAKNIILTDYTNTLPSIVQNNGGKNTNIDINFKYLSATYTNDFNAGYEALIGFSGLSVDRLPNKQVYFKAKRQIGYNKSTKTYYYYYSHPSYEADTTFAIKFGNYNANYNPNALNAFKRNSITDYVNDGQTYSNTFSSQYDTAQTFDATTENLFSLYFKHTNDSTYNKNNSYESISADEGDFSLNKLVAIGNGNDILGKNITGYSPAQMASNKYEAGQYCKKIDLFSIEKDSYQLVHSTTDTTVWFDSPKVKHFPGIFAVRGTVPINNKWFKYRNNGGIVETLNDAGIVKSFNNYHLQNAIYTTNGIYMPRTRTSNDVYPLTFNILNNFTKNGGDIDNNIRPLSTENLKKRFESHNKFVYKCEGIVKNKIITYDVYMEDIISYLDKKYKSVLNDIKNKDWVIYLINGCSNDMPLRFHGKISGNISPNQKKESIRILQPGECVEIIYSKSMYNGTGTMAGVINFEYK